MKSLHFEVVFQSHKGLLIRVFPRYRSHTLHSQEQEGLPLEQLVELCFKSLLFFFLISLLLFFMANTVPCLFNSGKYTCNK